MPRLHHVMHARKPIKDADIKKGDSYYWWKFRHSGKIVSKVYPKRSQLTQSEFLGSMYDFEDSLQGEAGQLRSGEMDGEDFASSLESTAEEVRSLGREQQEKASNVESAFPNGSPVIDLLNERAEKCDEIADALEAAVSEVRDLIPEETEDGEGDKESDGAGKSDDEDDAWREDAANKLDDVDWSVE